ncbi:hypothetical protein [Streptomyces sp. NPDC001348]
MTTDPSSGWRRWHEDRVETVSAPCGPLAPTGTHWIEDYPEGRLPDILGTWAVDRDGVVLTAAAADGLALDARPFFGGTRLAADATPYDPRRSVPGRCAPYEGTRTVRVGAAGGAERGLCAVFADHFICPEHRLR